MAQQPTSQPPEADPNQIPPINLISNEGQQTQDVQFQAQEVTVNQVGHQPQAAAVTTGIKRARKQEGKQNSEAWEHFTKVPGSLEAGKPKASCNYCGKEYLAGTKKHGTSNLLHHIEHQCQEYKKIEGQLKQKTLVFKSEQGLKAMAFNASDGRTTLAKMIIKDEMPFQIVEGEGFKEYSMVLQPKFVLPSRYTVKRDCLTLFSEEKEKLKNILKSQRVCLTTDTWTSIQNLNYMCLTAHWIDDQWKIHKKVLSFPTVANHKGETIGLAILSCLKDWGIEKIFTITVDNASTNDGAIKHVVKRTRDAIGTVLDHAYIHVRCCAHILNLIVQDGLKEVDDSVIKIRNAVRYVRSSPARLQSFQKCVEEEKIACKSHVCLDVETRWNSTYHMLEVAEKFEKAFDRLEYEDSRYNSYFLGGDEETVEQEDVIGGHMDSTISTRGRGRKRLRLIGPPTREDWKSARCLIEFLSLFYNATLKFSGTQYATSNMFFHELVALQQNIITKSQSNDGVLRGMAFKMLNKFTKYFVKVEYLNPLLHLAVVLDPRYKLRYVEYCMRLVYDPTRATEFAKDLESKLIELYECYLKEHPELGPATQGTLSAAADISAELLKKDPARALRLQFAKETGSSVNVAGKSEVQRYLCEVTEAETDTFDILLWWKVHSSMYPIIARIAKDILAVPITTVASESTFSTSGRVLDPYRSKLTPTTVEALICCQNWLRSTPKSIELYTELPGSESLEGKGTDGDSSSKNLDAQ